MKYAAIDIGGTFIKYALLDEKLNILQQKQVLTMALGDAQSFYDYLCDEMYHEQVDLIGICAPGIIDEAGVLLSATSGNASIMYHSSVIDEVERRTHVPTFVINDARAAALCEWQMGNCKGFKRSACYLIGTGIGGCLLDEQGVIEGHHHFSGEFSFMPVWNQDGSIEQLGNHASMSSLMRCYHTHHPDQYADGKIICERYLAGEKTATSCANHWLMAITMQLINITSIYDPEVICIGGAISKEAWFIEEINARYQAMCANFISPMLTFNTKIKACKFHNDSNLIGAIIHALLENKSNLEGL